ncbi:hypothetical protein EPD60_09530 [Flaviaesturariibacter flavus]|uniref:Carboxypeptidase regulatory-like domain-containing protein n=1 Tax=Flaviaesturariibacter flavus TaxID=2502780 RepID=A0A4R1BB61_9BACT|nr:hypothetical protein [Flaviaesturariibacter flavus]TCJ14236.1 hypothetical protein EPD60_09530 [Flaviaesturariibacter flavus]
MKKHFSNTLTRNLRQRALVLTVCATLFGGLTANAAGPIEDKPAVRVQGSAAINGQPVFQVTLNDEQHQGFALRITDEAGNLLYSEQIRAGAYSKRFQLAMVQSEDIRLYVELVPRSGQKAESYLVEGNAAAVQQLVVSRN